MNLEIGDSCWFFSARDAGDSAFSYFDSEPGTETRYAPVLRELIQSGWIDTLHSYGNFGANLPFQRKWAELAVEESRKHGLEFPVWVNHGELDRNPQSFGIDYGNADSPENSSIYHTDLLEQLGTIFFWESESFVTQIIGQDRPLSTLQAYFTNPIWTGFIDQLKYYYKIFNGFRNRWRRKSGKPIDELWLDNPKNNRLYQPVRLSDGKPMFRFSRFGHGRYDWAEDIPYFLNEKTLNRLAADGGTSILYVHIGDRRDRSQPVLSQETINGFRLLSSKMHKNREILVATTARLLLYHAIRDHLQYKVTQENGQPVIELHGVSNSLLNKYFQRQESLQGLTFYIQNPQHTRIQWLGKELPTSQNPPDNTGQFSVSIPWEPLPDFPIDALRRV